jgi:hypothetical protein
MVQTINFEDMIKVACVDDFVLLETQRPRTVGRAMVYSEVFLTIVERADLGCDARDGFVVGFHREIGKWMNL